MSHLPPTTTRLDSSRRAARAIKGIQELSESDDDLCALDYAKFSKSLGLASQEGFAIEDSKALLNLLVKPWSKNFLREFFQYRPVSLSISDPSVELSFLSYVAVLGYLASDNMLKTSMETEINCLYGVVHNSFTSIAEVMTSCLSELVKTTSQSKSVQLTFTNACEFLRQYLRRFRSAMEQWPGIIDIGFHIEKCFNEWQTIEPSKESLEPIRDHVQRLLRQMQRERERIELMRVPPPPKDCPKSSLSVAQLAHISKAYDPPGQLRPEGPRHDNDDDDFQSIEIAPTNQELQCKLPPALPINQPGARHHLPSGTMKRHLDLHFRLYREEFVALTRNAVQQVLQDLTRRRSELYKKFREKGGRYTTTLDHHTSIRFNIYTGVDFSKLTVNTRGLTTNIHCDTPPGRARDSSPNKRAEYWKSLHGKRLLYGSLVALVWPVQNGQPHVYLGTIATSPDDLSKGAKRNSQRLMFSISFFDPGVEQHVLNQSLDHIPKPTRLFLVEVPVMYDAIYPILRSLQQDPPVECFEQYLPLGITPSIHILPPSYSRRLDFKWNLACLLPEGNQQFTFESHHQASVCEAIATLRDSSALELTQATAMVEALSRELALIQGPPGTGKSRVVRDIIRVMRANDVDRILVVSFTNHTVDKTLEMLRDTGETGFVRLGGRSKNKQIAEFSLEKLEEASRNPPEVGVRYKNMRILGNRLKDIVEKLQSSIPEEDIMEWLKSEHPLRYKSLKVPPEHIISPNRVQNQTSSSDVCSPSLFSQWIKGRDIKLHKEKLIYLQDELSEENNNGPQSNHSSRVLDPPPTSNGRDSLPLYDPAVTSKDQQKPSRLLADLLVSEDIWLMTTEERKILFQSWEGSATAKLRDLQIANLKRAKEDFERARESWESVRDAHRLHILQGRNIIGCTTAGAAKMIKLIKDWEPRIIIVEEAGQVLEAHTLASLVNSVQHLVLVGDHLQLRPPLSNYALSMENPNGKILYRLNCSLLERLSEVGFPVSRLKRQRRMRQSISDLLRVNSYPDLEDDETVHRYPNVKGMKKDVYFLHHTNQESSSREDGISKSNQFEASMAVNLYRYLRRQGNYSITILATYLAQIPIVLDELRRNELCGQVDDRDAEALAEEDELVSLNDTPGEDIRSSDRVTIRTVDNYQGEEADIVILMLVRNSGFDSSAKDDYKSSIGFLKNNNRTNVALSRARLGLYILGNADDLSSKSVEWKKIIEHLKLVDALGDAIPLACQRHPNIEQRVSGPGDFLQVAPDGGCILPCNALLPCGHACPAKCHPDHDTHDSIHCDEPCERTCEAEGHLCKRQCGDDCDECLFPVDHVLLRCGHKVNLTCHGAQNPDSVLCPIEMVKELLSCEHTAKMPCHQNPATYACHAPCGRLLPCCGRPCKSQCSECQRLSGDTERIKHSGHHCGRHLSCGHSCEEDCATSQGVCSGDCFKQCAVVCDHGPCRIPCSKPCTPCAKPCTWSCTHFRCDLPCAFPCRRPPCNAACPNKLRCGHQCPSLCGEKCDFQICPQCASEDQRQQVVEFLENTTLAEIWETEKPPSRLITLSCGHAFTVNTLDQWTKIDLYYAQCSDGPEARDGSVDTIPTCPHCRSPIRVARYTRIRKLAHQTLLDHKEAQYVLSGLKQLHARLQSLGDLETSLLDHINPTHLTGAPSREVLEVATRQEDILRSAPRTRPIPLRFFLHQKLVSDHGLGGSEASAWVDTIDPLLKLYHDAEKLRDRRGGSIQIFDRALEHATRARRTRISTGGPTISRSVEQVTFQSAHNLVGQKPLPEYSGRIRAILLTVEIRLKITQLAQVWLSTLRERRTSSESHKQLWERFIVFIYDTCLADTALANRFAESGKLQRQKLQCQVSMGRLEVQRFRFTAQTQLRLGVSDEVRANQEKEVQSIWGERYHQLHVALQQYRNVFQTLHTDDEEFLESQFFEPMSSLVNEWEAIRASILSGSVFLEVTGEEKRDIRRAFGFDARGHWYKCPNGHQFVVTECGGALEETRCPECSEPIGGHNHTTLDGVRRDRAMERLEAERGVPTSPWQWAQDA